MLDWLRSTGIFDKSAKTKETKCGCASSKDTHGGSPTNDYQNTKCLRRKTILLGCLHGQNFDKDCFINVKRDFNTYTSKYAKLDFV